MVFPITTYGCESWTLKQADRKKIDSFELWCWRKLLRVSWTDKRTNKSILQEIKPEYSLEASIVKLKLSYFGHIMRRHESLEKEIMLGTIEGKRRRVNGVGPLTSYVEKYITTVISNLLIQMKIAPYSHITIDFDENYQYQVHVQQLQLKTETQK
ncbi:unnamed protein product [Rotaria magnacalcarata]